MASDKFVGFPYPITKKARGFLATQKGVDQVKSDMLALLLTNQGERVMMPNFGCNLRKFLFEPNDLFVTQEIKSTIAQQLRLWEPRIIVDQIEVSIGADVEDLNPADTLSDVDSILFIKITFFDPDNIVDAQKLELNYSFNTSRAPNVL